MGKQFAGWCGYLMMRAVSLFVLCLFAVAEAAPRSISRWGTRQHPIFGLPVDCIGREIAKVRGTNSTLPSAIDTCSSRLCTCLNGTNNLPTSYNGGVMQCTGFNITFPDGFRARANDRTCNNLQDCYPTYVRCIREVAIGCVQPVLEQCDEYTNRYCDEGSICKDPDFPEGISAGGIFATTAGILFLVFALVAIGSFLAARKKRKPVRYADDEEEVVVVA